MANRLIYQLSELDSSFVAEAGGKGASLGELMRAPAPVPLGFVVTSSVGIFRGRARGGLL